MERPQVRLIDSQSEEQGKDITGWEAEQLLRKYGYEPEHYSSHTQPIQNVEQPGLTFEEMLAQDEAKRRDEELRRRQRQFGPKPTTFDSSRGYDSEVRFSSDEDTGFGFKIEITSDMKLPKY